MTEKYNFGILKINENGERIHMGSVKNATRIPTEGELIARPNTTNGETILYSVKNIINIYDLDAQVGMQLNGRTNGLETLVLVSDVDTPEGLKKIIDYTNSLTN